MNESLRTTFTKEIFERMVSEKLRLIRTEARLTQEQMADAIGLSKKTLVQVEKERKTLGFTAAALVGVLFRNSEIVQAMFGDSTLEIVELLAFTEVNPQAGELSGMEWIAQAQAKARYQSTGRRIWWKDEKIGQQYMKQSHILTGHFRIVDKSETIHYYGTDSAEADARLVQLEHSRHSQEKGE
ncbi:helix-turn-helix transcriptional regulator [Aneurinibacillus aneurinilyticus]|uniref:helix-turn-helix transcriptional regulator n=1 Tax=Aneurinibacillus aneurinilyticus TaxID=1391 RepID=UPI0023F0811F|nr:helix-turn-helix transcriptional regulator [Aneurinibacillus aneurinilyticus]MED0670298.1 helix-turn-helix transcriptional regulator [Aneurinibacillus aneurinilyticus]